MTCSDQSNFCSKGLKDTQERAVGLYSEVITKREESLQMEGGAAFGSIHE